MSKDFNISQEEIFFYDGSMQFIGLLNITHSLLMSLQLYSFEIRKSYNLHLGWLKGGEGGSWRNFNFWVNYPFKQSIVKSSQVTFIYIALLTIQIVSKHLTVSSWRIECQ